MTDHTPAGSRGAIDLSGIADSPTPGSPTATGRPVPEGLVIEVTPETLQSALGKTMNVAGALVIWSSAHEQMRVLVDEFAQIAQEVQGRLLVLTADIAVHPTLMQAFQPVIMQAFGQLAVPATFGVLQGQPVPLFSGLPGGEQIRTAVEQLLQAAVSNGIAGRVNYTPVESDEPDELPPLHQAAFDAIEQGDLEGAAAAYTKALAENPKDSDAAIGLAQVGLMRRTDGVDVAAARAQAAEHPDDVDAAILVADCDLLGGHVEDAFTRLLDLVRVSAGEDRDRARSHLIELFSVVGNHDDRVKKGRTALMAALF